MADQSFIDAPEQVEELAGRLAAEPVIAVDTEADSFFHYHDKLCLIQVGASFGTYLIDPLALPEDGLEALAPVLASPDVRKILHAAEYDLYMLGRRGLAVRNIFDTMISAQLLGYPAIGLGALVERHFDIRLAKDQQRTDWSRRPLRDAQIEYAAADVLYLIELADKVESELDAKGRLHWAQEEFVALEARTWPEREFDEQGYLRIKGARKLSPRSLAILRELFLMRDARARLLDKPPFKVLGNGTLLELAQNPARSRRTLARRKGITDLVLRRMGQEIIDAVSRGMDGPEHPQLERKREGTGRKRLDRSGDRRLERLKQWRQQRAAALELDPGVFAPNATLEEIAWGRPESVDELAELSTVKGWWAREFGDEVLERLVESEGDGEAPAEAKAASRSSSGRGKRSRRRRSRKSGSRASGAAKSSGSSRGSEGSGSGH